MKKAPSDWEWEKKPKKVVKGTNKAGKHRKNIYNMLSDYQEKYEEPDSDGKINYKFNSNLNYSKQR